VSTRGERFLADNAVQSFWATLQQEYVVGQLAT